MTGLPTSTLENVHDSTVALGPIAFREAVHQADIDVVGTQFFAKAVEIGAGLDRIARPRFCENRDLVAGEVLERLRHMRMAAIGVGSVEKTQAIVMAIEQQIGQAFHAQSGLVRVMSAADCAGPHRETTSGDSGFAQHHCVCRGELARQRRQRTHGPGQASRPNPRRSHSGGCPDDEVSAFHGASSK